MSEYTLRLYGRPIPQGSTRAWIHQGRANVTHDNAKTKPWRQDIADVAIAHGVKPIDGPVRITLAFWLPRPSSRPKRHRYPDVMPDLDKLVRAVLDALTGIAFANDSQVISLAAEKDYATEANRMGAHITIGAAL